MQYISLYMGGLGLFLRRAQQHLRRTSAWNPYGIKTFARFELKKTLPSHTCSINHISHLSHLSHMFHKSHLTVSHLSHMSHKSHFTVSRLFPKSHLFPKSWETRPRNTWDRVVDRLGIWDILRNIREIHVCLNVIRAVCPSGGRIFKFARTRTCI